MAKLTYAEKQKLTELVTDSVRMDALSQEDMVAILRICSEAISLRMREVMREMNQLPKQKGEDRE